MTEFLSFTIAGLSLAAILAVAASGLVLTYTTTGVFNFAHGAIGMLGAFAYWQLRFDWGWPTPIAIAVVLLVLGPLFGVFLEVVDLPRPATDDRNDQARRDGLVAVLDDRHRELDLGSERVPSNATKFGGPRASRSATCRITCHELITIIVAILVAIGSALPAVPHPRRHRDAGRGRRPAARRAARRPARSLVDARVGDRLLARGARAGSSSSARSSSPAAPMSLLIVNAYAAAMIGRLRSLPLTFLGALILGLLDGYSQGYLVVRTTSTSTRRSSPRCRSSCCSSCCSCCPARGCGPQGIARTRELIPMPTMRGALIFAAVVVAGAALAIPLLTRANTVTHGAASSASASSRCRWCRSIGLAGQVSLAQWALRRNRRGHDGAPRRRAARRWASSGRSSYRGSRRRAHRAPDAAALRASTSRSRPRRSRCSSSAGSSARAFDLPFTDVKIAIFETGSLSVEPARTVRLHVRHRIPSSSCCWRRRSRSSCIFVAWLRRGPFGRRLLAMKDSPGRVRDGRHEPHVHEAHRVRDLGRHRRPRRRAASVACERSTNQQNWEFAAGLPIFMVGVVGGIARIGGPLFAGISLATLDRDPDVADPQQHRVAPATSPRSRPASWASASAATRTARSPTSARASSRSADSARSRLACFLVDARGALRARARRRRRRVVVHPRRRSSR